MVVGRKELTSYPLASLFSGSDVREGDDEQQQQQQQRKRRVVPLKRKSRVQQALDAANEHPGCTAALGAAAFYTALRAGIEVFHLTRRRFLRELLFDLCPALDALGQTYWIDFGSLLGIHREGDLILHDNDVDMAILNPDWEVLLAGLRKHVGHKYNVKVVTPRETPDTHWIRVYCPLGMADLFGAYLQDGDEKVRVDFGHGDTADIQRELVLPTGRTEFRGVEMSVPSDIEGTLEFRYGPTWRTPRYMDKGTDTVEANKLYARIFRALSYLGIRF